MKNFIFIATLFFAVPTFADDNIVILLDTSGSMDGWMDDNQTKMKAAQFALLEVLKNIGKDTNIGLIDFDGWVYPLSAINHYTIQTKVLELNPGGGTPLGEFMKMGVDALLQKRKQSHGYGTYTLLVITDGEATDEHLLDKYLPDILSRGIILKTIGIKMSEDHNLKNYSTKYYRGDDLEGLKHAISNALAEMPSNNSDDSGDYALIQGIPDEMVLKVTETISETVNLNHPIGEGNTNLEFTTITSQQNVSDGFDAVIWVLVIILSILLVLGISIAIFNCN